MTKEKTSEKLRRISHLRLLIPGLLVAVLALDGLLGYTMPDFSEAIDAAPQKVYAAEAPELEELVQTGEKVESKGPAGKLAKVDESGDYKDGEYTGSAKGFGGTITVKVTIKDGKITSIKVLSASGETSSFFARAKAVIGVILNKQSTNVDAVSGATYSSNGIIKAVRNALAKAAKKKSDKKKSKDDDSDDTETGGTDTDQGTGTAEKSYKDGTYTRTAACIKDGWFDYDIDITLTVKDGRISSLSIYKGEDYTEEESDREENDGYLDMAVNGYGSRKGMISRILDSQSADVDTVTGATYSSEAIRSAVSGILSGIVTEKKTEEDKKPEDEDTVAAPDKTEDADVPAETAEPGDEITPEEDTAKNSEEAPAEDPEPEVEESTDDAQERVKESDPPPEKEDPPEESSGQEDGEG